MAMKTAANFFDVWGGVAGVQTTLAALTTQSHLVPPPTIARVTSGNVARRFGIERKGRIEPGFDADLALVDLDAKYELTRDMLHDRHKLSPFVGLTFRGRVMQTILRGRTICENGKITGPPAGKLVRPSDSRR